jgi:hypothetical protein
MTRLSMLVFCLAINEVAAVEHTATDDKTQDTQGDRNIELSLLTESYEKQLQEMRTLMEDMEVKHQKMVAELNTQLHDLEADHVRTVEEINSVHHAEVEKLQAIISQRSSEQQAKMV